MPPPLPALESRRLTRSGLRAVPTPLSVRRFGAPVVQSPVVRRAEDEPEPEQHREVGTAAGAQEVLHR